MTRDRYIISKYTHTSILDVDEITPMERKMIIKYIIEDLQQQKDAMAKASNAAKDKLDGNKSTSE